MLVKRNWRNIRIIFLGGERTSSLVGTSATLRVGSFYVFFREKLQIRLQKKKKRYNLETRGGVEDTRLEAKAKAKDTKKIRGQGQGQGQPFRGQTLSRPRTRMLEAKAKDQGHRRKCSLKKKSSKIFFRRSPIHRCTQNFWLGRSKPQITWNDVIKIFPKRKFLWDK